MARAPRFRRGDTVYLNSSAAVGRLEGYRVADVRQLSPGRWSYRIDFIKKPPQTELIGDTFDGRVIHPTLFFNEADLLTLCQALDRAVLSYNNKINRAQAKIDSCCVDDLEDPIPGDSKFNINDVVYFHTSARIGFLERGIIRDLFEVGVQTGSKQRRYSYRVRFDSPNSLNLLFRQDELLTLCEALPLILAYLERKRDELIARRDSLCANES